MMNQKIGYEPLLTLSDSKLSTEAGGADLRDGSVYVFTNELRLATEVALVTGRPLLLKGEPGGGKSSWAAYVARNLKWPYYEFVVNAKTQPGDLLYSFDILRRLNDAQAQQIKPNNEAYIIPGMLWWALDRASAANQVATAGMANTVPSPNDNRKGKGAVLLIDEIDKADPDVPNGLLVPLGSQTFTVSETGQVVSNASKVGGDTKRRSPLIIFSTNGERALPQAFLRRCIVFEFEKPDADLLVKVARKHFGSKDTLPQPQEELASALADKFMELRAASRNEGLRLPGIAEYLDAMRACIELGINPDSPNWALVQQVAWKKETKEGR